MIDKSWLTGSGESIEFNEMFLIIKDYVRRGGKIFIGTDSQLSVESCTFATAICLHGAEGSTSGGRYFFQRTIRKQDQYKILKVRIMQEVHRSIEIALQLFEENPKADIEIHLDVGTTDRSKTRTYVDELRGWTQSVGFKCRVKPNAWASASVADKHTK
jgi:predicted RNase H-related nuclease YkuK (DUF458 family)